jgi:hypothetical protein
MGRYPRLLQQIRYSELYHIATSGDSGHSVEQAQNHYVSSIGATYAYFLQGLDLMANVPHINWPT